jgi:hypothetical protein
MMKKYLNIAAVTLAVLLSFVAMPLVSVYASSAAANSVLDGADQANAEGPSVNNAIATGVNLLSMLAGLASVIMIIVGGYRFITSGGDASKAKTARSTVVYACIGLAIVATAQVILRTVVARVGSQ